MQQLADAHAQNLAALTANYRAKQLEERKDAETVSSVLFFRPDAARRRRS